MDAGTLLVPFTAADTAVKTAAGDRARVLEVASDFVVNASVILSSDFGVPTVDVRLDAPHAPPLISNAVVVPARRMVRNLSFSCTLDLSLNWGPSSLSMRISDHTFLCPLYFLTPSNNARSSVAENGRYFR
ncbi:hypothetical protein PsorP6_016017 [Peronosclerospora sorghi]|uniref:Uncharacterized protein n=1 Tax=Peronosclerospora sorghi TaxID=230839 RepID=A0ACC0WNX8_9STRA|nr:hypothetical protein PsorP6_016017 [Peronosclerospora sorghi]